MPEQPVRVLARNAVAGLRLIATLDHWRYRLRGRVRCAARLAKEDRVEAAQAEQFVRPPEARNAIVTSAPRTAFARPSRLIILSVCFRLRPSPGRSSGHRGPKPGQPLRPACAAKTSRRPTTPSSSGSELDREPAEGDDVLVQDTEQHECVRLTSRRHQQRDAVHRVGHPRDQCVADNRPHRFTHVDALRDRPIHLLDQVGGSPW